jgi:hypothetical protein
LPDPGYGGKCDRDLLLEMIAQASDKLDTFAAEGSDKHGQTRRLILRLGSTVRVGRVAQEYVGKGKYKEIGMKLEAILHERKQALDDALKTLKDHLPPPSA